MPDLTIWFSRADFIEMGEFLAEEGSNFGNVWEKHNRILGIFGTTFGRILGRRQSEAHLIIV